MSQEYAKRLVEVDPGTPGGDLLRRYWHPLCPISSVRATAPLCRVEILGESLVVIQLADGTCIAIGERCPHRGASLRYGYVEDGGIRCAYHGWLFDQRGACVESPFERSPRDLRTACYPTKALAGLLFVYMGPRETMTPLPMWDMLVQDYGAYRIHLQEEMRCNWVQVQENSADVTHTFFLHSRRFRELGLPDESGYDRRMTSYGFQPFPWGILKSWTYEDADGRELEGWGSPLVFPNMLHIEREIHWRVPVNLLTTRVIIVAFDPDGVSALPSTVIEPSRWNDDGAYRLDTFFAQDALAWETQGSVTDHAKEHLASSDTGVHIFRRMLLREMERVEKGLVPMATLAPDAPSEAIVTRKWMGGYVPMSASPDTTFVDRLPKEEVFDERHQTFRTTLEEIGQ
jgi:5,5'-dehydrodivanillate O-demethylase